jgi:hypothetical protein
MPGANQLTIWMFERRSHDASGALAGEAFNCRRVCRAVASGNDDCSAAFHQPMRNPQPNATVPPVTMAIFPVRAKRSVVGPPGSRSFEIVRSHRWRRRCPADRRSWPGSHGWQRGSDGEYAHCTVVSDREDARLT